MMTISRPKRCQPRALPGAPVSTKPASNEAAFAGGTGQKRSVRGPDQLDALPTRQ
jgi:hypothetical protein